MTSASTGDEHSAAGDTTGEGKTQAQTISHLRMRGHLAAGDTTGEETRDGEKASSNLDNALHLHQIRITENIDKNG